jgi:RHS repeat-associated protein
VGLAHPFQEPFTGQDYVRARWYDPSSGSWLTPDAMGYRDSSNLYGYAGGDPVNQRDSTGMYEEDVHQWLTVFLARAAGFDEETARDIGLETEQLDLDSRDAMYQIVSPENMYRYHMVPPWALTLMREDAVTWMKDSRAQPGVRLYRLGEYLHALEDSYAHQSSPLSRDFAQTYNTWFGHALEGHEPDWTWMRINVAMDMAEDVFTELHGLCLEASASTCTALRWEEIQGTVERFVAYKPGLTGELHFGGLVMTQNATAAGLQSKIDILNSFLTGKYAHLLRPMFLTDQERDTRIKSQRAFEQYSMRLKAWRGTRK